MIKSFFLIIILLIFPFFTYAKDFSFSGYTETGERSTSEDYEEEDTDDDYAYEKHNLKFEHKISNLLKYNAGMSFYDKDYKDNDSLDSISRILKAGFNYYIKKDKAESSKLDIKFKYKEKRFDNKPINEYDQIVFSPAFTFKRKDLYSIGFNAGINNYDYREAAQKDEFKIFGKIKGNRYFLNKNLILNSSYKIETADRKNIGRKKTMHDITGGLDYIFALSWLYKFTARAGWGERDTKEEDERDEDYDYEYRRYYVKTEHRINEKLKANLKYQYFKKDYVSADLDNRGFYILNGCSYEIINDKTQRFWFSFNTEYKEADYPLKVNNNYKKETFGIKVNYKRKKEWKVTAALKEKIYDFNDSSKDKKRYYALVAYEKLFLDGDLALSLNLKYRRTDYDQKNNTEEEAVRVAFKYKF
jgi:hypothetical protein